MSKRRDVLSMRLALASPLASNAPRVPLTQEEFQRAPPVGGSASLRPRTGWAWLALESRGTDRPKRKAVLFELELTSKHRKRRKWHEKKRNKKDLGSLSYPFLFVLLPCVCQPLKLKVVTEGKIGQPMHILLSVHCQ